MADDAEVQKIIAAVVRTTLVTTIVSQMLSTGLDVTDDVIAREAMAYLDKQVEGKQTAKAMLSQLKPADFIEWAGAFSKAMRNEASMAVAAAIDVDPGATEQQIAQFIWTKLQATPFAEVRAESVQTLAMLLAVNYSAMCRRSGLTPQSWAQAFHQTVNGGHWTFHRG